MGLGRSEGPWKKSTRVFGKRLEQLHATSGKFKINQSLFADDTAIV